MPMQKLRVRKQRSIVHVEPRLKEFAPYDFWLLGTPAAGLGARIDETVTHRLVTAWQNMMRRCYDPDHQYHSSYGAKGISVCKRWHTVALYVGDVQKLYGWASKEADWDSYQLDKDYYGSNQYSPETCIWLPRGLNNEIDRVQITVVLPSGEALLFLSIMEASRYLGVSDSALYRLAACEHTCVKGPLKGHTLKFAPPIANLRYAL